MIYEVLTAFILFLLIGFIVFVFHIVNIAMVRLRHNLMLRFQLQVAFGDLKFKER